MIYFPCPTCATSLSAGPDQVGQLVRCPHCTRTLRVPQQAVADAQTAVPPPVAPREKRAAIERATAGFNTATGRRFGFPCPYCSSRLEATDGMSGQERPCPTCGNEIVIPIMDRRGRLIDPLTRKIIKQDPHPVHAYAASGHRAPKIMRVNGANRIQCPRCQALNDVSANNCSGCRVPFTMEGTLTSAEAPKSSLAVASLSLGLVSIPTGCTLILPIVAIVLGLMAIGSGTPDNRTKGRAIGGIVCGLIGLVVFVFTVLL